MAAQGTSRSSRRVTDWGCRGGLIRRLRQCSPVGQSNTFWLSEIEQRDDHQGGATQHFQRSERHRMREQWHRPKCEHSGQRAVPKKPVVSRARHGHPSNLWASPSKSQPNKVGLASNQKDNGTPHFVVTGYLSHFQRRLDRQRVDRAKSRQCLISHGTSMPRSLEGNMSIAPARLRNVSVGGLGCQKMNALLLL
jgi:hypothetical protein